ncbi:hypothetical protein SNE40_000695 [Patella caerulea]|uniref:Chitin-binding type-2 domain-containing protein n=1 Tax=Patella caerulea TaxID=87958 RepID=A0AAN8Q7C3_PATCE
MEGVTEGILFFFIFVLSALGNDRFCVGRTEQFYPYISDCTKYYQCSNGQTYISDCPSSLVWNQALERCDGTCDQSHPELDVPTTVQQTTFGVAATTTPKPQDPARGCGRFTNLLFIPDGGITVVCPILEERTTSTYLECLNHCVRRTGCTCLNFMKGQLSSNCNLLDCGVTENYQVAAMENGLVICL